MIATTDVQLTARTHALTISGLPPQAQWSWEGKPFTPTTGVAFVKESFTGGPRFQATIGQFGEIEQRPLYVLYPHAPAGSGLTVRRLADLIIAGFPPGLQIALPGGDTLVVDDGPAPTQGAVARSADHDGFVTVMVAIPMWLRTDNSI